MAPVPHHLREKPVTRNILRAGSGLAASGLRVLKFVLLTPGYEAKAETLKG
jgi:hypothetical protein